MLILQVCYTAHTIVSYMQLYFFGTGNQLLLLYMDALFFTALLFLGTDFNSFVYLDPHAKHLLEDHDDLQILIKMM